MANKSISDMEGLPVLSAMMTGILYAGSLVVMGVDQAKHIFAAPAYTPEAAAQAQLFLQQAWEIGSTVIQNMIPVLR